jgi:hypothetical protein
VKSPEKSPELIRLFAGRSLIIGMALRRPSACAGRGPALQWGMPALSRRRDPDAREECWLIHYGDVHVGTIRLRTGCPVDVDQWTWSCGFYPGSHRGEHEDGTAVDFEQARAAFEAAWLRILPTQTEADFQAWRDERDSTAWKYAMWDAGMRMPTQMPSGRSRCFCGAEIDIRGVEDHVRAAHRTTAVAR